MEVAVVELLALEIGDETLLGALADEGREAGAIGLVGEDSARFRASSKNSAKCPRQAEPASAVRAASASEPSDAGGSSVQVAATGGGVEAQPVPSAARTASVGARLRMVRVVLMWLSGNQLSSRARMLASAVDAFGSGASGRAGVSPNSSPFTW